ncbi:MAG TPA: S9 family peptidase, partial [Planctomycetia bacterium]|nr:S9 family peptidase [Planctomycetia bacterium]
MGNVRWRLAAAMIGASLLATGAMASDKLKYPESKRIDVVEEYHGEKVVDPYRWLEDDVRVNKDVAAWVAEQNKVTGSYLETIPQRAAIKKRLTELWNYERYTAPNKIGGRYFFSKNDGLQNQSVLYVQDSLDAPAKVLLDPNKLSKDGTVALAGMAFSDDAKYLAYAVAVAGSDWTTWKVLDVATGANLSDEIKWVKFAGASWTKDGRGFFYSRYPEPKQGATFQSLNVDQKLYYHRLGSPQSDDVLVHERPDHPRWSVGGEVTEDGRYLVIEIGDGTTSRKSAVYVKDLAEPYGMPVAVIPHQNNKWTPIANDGPIFYFLTEFKAPKNQVLAIDIREPDPKNWKTIVPEGKDVLQSVGCVAGMFVCEYLQDAKSMVKIHGMDGRFIRDVELPGIGTAGGFGGKRTDIETFYTFSSFATPPSIFRYDLITGKSELFRAAKVKFDPADYEVKQVFFPSKDGTKIPMFIAHKKG